MRAASPRRWPLRIAGIVASLLALLVGFVAWLGYFGGPVYRVVPATAPQRPIAAVFLSGDTGLNMGMGPRVVTLLAAHGVPVVAINTLTAFATRRTPAQTAALVAEAARRALALPGVARVVLIGQSAGADMLQAGVADLPAALRPRIAQVILTVPGDTLLFKATPGGVLDGTPDGPALPSARRIDWVPLLCIHGATEDNSLCPLLHQRNVRTVVLPGDHYLNHDAERLERTLWAAIAPHG
ncbi:AcvB/VirJ family lysyl-phosphatidylglycerol hydrolase [Sphingomonas adhaesiva]|uniref:AcvB/VirJ family lysyl-phosphatidylglycerol hydrolase n=1 Tax=Sphingomonas adhaesiva TaxID=28212 RepID=UPI002FF53F63